MKKKQLGKKFDGAYEQFLEDIMNTKEREYLELDKYSELKYLKYHRYRFKTIFLSLPSLKAKIKLLDIGTTPFTLFVKEFYPNYDVSTIDLTDLMEERCEKKDVTFKRCNLMKDKIPFENNSFDVVIFTEVFEHLFMPASKIFYEISYVLKKGGILIFGTPNYAKLSNRIELLFGINPQTSIEKMTRTGYVHGHSHVREYTMNECISILRNSGFSIKEANFERYWNRLDVHLLHREESTKFLPCVFFVYDLICMVAPSTRSGIHIVATKK